MRRFLLTTAAALLLTAAAPAPDEAPVITRGNATLAGKSIAYTAQAGRLPLRDGLSGQALGQVFYVAYRVPQPAGAPPRPITFVLPGGPGGSDLYLHMAYGPKRVENARVIDNPNSLLGVTDLVFIDPVGSGFSRLAGDGRWEDYYNTLGDTAALAETIRAWQALYDDDADAPMFILGQSYGVWRTAMTTELTEKRGRRVAGAVMIAARAPVGELNSRITERGLYVPHHAAVAFVHGRLSPDKGRDVASVMRGAEAWARSVYIPALERGEALSAAEREKVATELAGWIGLPADAIDRKTLVYSPNEFRQKLLKDKGQVVLGNDMRKIEQPRTAEQEANSAAEIAYLRRDLGYRTDLAYTGLGGEPLYGATPPSGKKSAAIPFAYNSGNVTAESVARLQGGGGPPGGEPWIARAMAIDPKLTVFNALGRFDSLNSCTNYEDMLRKVDRAITDRMTVKCYDGGHSLQSDPQASPVLAADIRAFISGRLKSR